MHDNRNHLLRSHIIALTNYLKSNEKIEKRIAYDKDKLETHFRKWNPNGTFAIKICSDL